ncbi:hypothetical protein SCACP_09760 [Sporomusa carbonis]|uniref:hypothetical protein n=1 Tax=Sporomusa carbonis TaxID=3076075 RepID=UPI003A77A63F
MKEVKAKIIENFLDNSLETRKSVFMNYHNNYASEQLAKLSNQPEFIRDTETNCFLQEVFPPLLQKFFPT